MNRLFTIALILLGILMSSTLLKGTPSKTKNITLLFEEGKSEYKIPLYNIEIESDTFLLNASSGDNILIGYLERLKKKKFRQAILTLVGVDEPGTYILNKKGIAKNYDKIEIEIRYQNPLWIKESTESIEIDLSKDTSFLILVENRSNASIEMDTPRIEVVKEGHNYFTTKAKLHYVQKQIPPGQSLVRVNLNGDKFESGKYSGKFILRDKAGNEVSEKIIAYAKDPKWIALLVLFFGLVVGFLTAVYNNNKAEIELYSQAESLSKLINLLPSSPDKTKLQSDITIFFNTIGDILDTFESKKNRLQSIYDQYKKAQGMLVASPMALNKSESVKILRKEVFAIFANHIRPWLIFLSSCIVALVVFNELYISDSTFGSERITDYITLLLGGAASSSTLEIIFGKTYSQINPLS